VEAGLADGGLEAAAVFDAVPQDSDTEVVERVAEHARSEGADAFVAIGGGSVMDTAKAANVLFTHGGRVRDWEGLFALPREQDGQGAPLPMAPLACVPTTAGTGSEVSFAAVVKDASEGVKVEVADFALFPRLAVLDPESTRTLPAGVAAATGMDALTHALEGYVSSEWSPHGDAFALHALRLIREHLERAVAEPEDEDARGNMLVAASLAIVPSGNGAIGISHSMAHACGGRHGVPHGVANAIVLPHVVEWNSGAGPEVLGRYGHVAEVLGVGANGDVGPALAAHLAGLRERLGLPRTLSEVGVPAESVSALAEAAMGDGCTLVNPREPTREDFEGLFRRAL
jgi:alcohol dehydrogenase class IV